VAEAEDAAAFHAGAAFHEIETDVTRLAFRRHLGFEEETERANHLSSLVPYPPRFGGILLRVQITTTGHALVPLSWNSIGTAFEW
jgi:hypothetical protein